MEKLQGVREIRFYAYTSHNSEKCKGDAFTIGEAYNGSEFSGPLVYRRVIPGGKQRVDCDSGRGESLKVIQCQNQFFGRNC